MNADLEVRRSINALLINTLSNSAVPPSTQSALMIFDVIISELTLRKSAYTASMLVALISLTKCVFDINVSIRAELENNLLIVAFELLICDDSIIFALNPDVTILPAFTSTKLPTSAVTPSANTFFETKRSMFALSVYRYSNLAVRPDISSASIVMALNSSAQSLAKLPSMASIAYACTSPFTNKSPLNRIASATASMPDGLTRNNEPTVSPSIRTLPIWAYSGRTMTLDCST